jgi:hypothetical protein
VRVRVDHGKGKPGSNKIVFTLKALDNAQLQVKEEAVFLVPKYGGFPPRPQGEMSCMPHPCQPIVHTMRGPGTSIFGHGC